MITEKINILNLRNTFDFKSWHFNEVRNPDHEEHYIFYKLLPPLHYIEVISPKLVIGSVHSDYYEKTWLAMLLTLKRDRHYYDLNKLKEFIEDESFSEKKSLTKINGKYYIDGGNHRICYAKFLEYDQITCSVMERVFDHEAFALFNKLLSLSLVPRIENEITPCRNRWSVSIGQYTIAFDHFQQIQKFVDQFETIKTTFIDALQHKVFHLNPPYLKYSNRKEVKDMLIAMKVLATSKQNLESRLIKINQPDN